MPSHAHLMRTIQTNWEPLREALGPQDSATFEKHCEELFQLAREDPTKSEEVYTKLLEVIQDYPAAAHILLQVMPELSNALEELPAETAGDADAHAQAASISTDNYRENIEQTMVRGTSTLYGGNQQKNTVIPAAEHMISKQAEAATFLEETSYKTEGSQQGNHAHLRKEQDARHTGRSSARQKQWTPEQVAQFFKEIITAAMGLLLVGYTLYVVNTTLSFVGDARRLPDAKDLLLLLLSLTGVVLGYYFGRIPADARTTESQQRADKAIAWSEHVGKKAEEITRSLDDILSKPTDTRSTGEIIGPEALEQLYHLRGELRELSNLSRWT